MPYLQALLSELFTMDNVDADAGFVWGREVGGHFIAHPTFMNRAMIFSRFTMAHHVTCLVNAFAFRLLSTLGHHATLCSDTVQCMEFGQWNFQPIGWERVTKAWSAMFGLGPSLLRKFS